MRIFAHFSFAIRSTSQHPLALAALGLASSSSFMKTLHKCSQPQVRQVVDSNDKKRFVLDDSAQPPRVRAAQGHSVQLEAPVLEPVGDAAAATPLGAAVHVTSAEGWAAIQVRGGLGARRG
jgi:RNA:NAD 2'-phosphotransferase (TPT1/KptA family)